MMAERDKYDIHCFISMHSIYSTYVIIFYTLFLLEIVWIYILPAWTNLCHLWIYKVSHQ